jgi:hypothetical protein
VITPEAAQAAALPAEDVGTDRAFRLAVFGLARHLKAVPELRDRKASELRPLVHQWHQQAASRLGGRTATDGYAQFVVAWKAVRFAAGDDVVKLAWELVQRQPVEATGYGDERIDTLIALCRAIQRENEFNGHGARFALSGYVVARLFGVSQPTTAAWLAMLVADGVLEVVDAGGGFRGGRRLAPAYRRVDPT